MRYGVCYYVLGCIEPYLEFVEDESLECVIHRVKTNDFTGVRFARTGLDEVPYINICDENGYCLCRIPVSELQYNSYGYILDNYGDDDSDDVNTAEQGEPVDVENTSASEQGNTVEKSFLKASLKSSIKYLPFPICIFAFIFLIILFFYSRHFVDLNKTAFAGGFLFSFSFIELIHVIYFSFDSFLSWFKQRKAVDK
jgi:hypothetical protein